MKLIVKILGFMVSESAFAQPGAPQSSNDSQKKEVKVENKEETSKPEIEEQKIDLKGLESVRHPLASFTSVIDK